MYSVKNYGVEGWDNVPDLKFSKKISLHHNTPTYDNDSDINVLCLLESEAVVENFSPRLLYKYNLILTWRKEILENFNNSKKFLFGTTWVKEIKNTNIKKNRISFLTSSKVITEGHVFRKNIYNEVSKINLVNDLEILCLTTPPTIDNKNIILDRSKFSIIMENDSRDNYFSEKIIDCFATKTIPIYWGCPNIGEYFDEKGILHFSNISEFYKIFNSINSSTYDSFYESIEYNFFEAKKYHLYWERIEQEIKKI